MSDVNIRVDGPTLQKLLSDEAKLKLDSFATEKIAEEITRKIVGGRADNQIRFAFQKAQNEILGAYKDRWRFPQEAKNAIERITTDYIRASFAEEKLDVKVAAKSALEEVMSEQKRRMTAWLDEEFNTRTVEMLRHVKNAARSDFLDVLKEARESGMKP